MEPFFYHIAGCLLVVSNGETKRLEILIQYIYKFLNYNILQIKDIIKSIFILIYLHKISVFTHPILIYLQLFLQEFADIAMFFQKHSKGITVNGNSNSVLI